MSGYGYLTNYNNKTWGNSMDETLNKTFCGTTNCQAPEVLYGDVRKNSDLFSIGMTIYFIYFGKIIRGDL